MTDLISALVKGWTPGGVGIWTLVVIVLIAWWQGLPKVLHAIANRQSNVEQRMGALLKAATERFEREIVAADKRHEDCIAGQVRLQERIHTLEECVSEQQDTIAGFKRQIVQMQISAVRIDGTPLSPLVQGAIDQLDTMQEAKRR